MGREGLAGGRAGLADGREGLAGVVGVRTRERRGDVRDANS